MEIRQATIENLETLYRIESSCFNELEACSYEQLKQRLMTYSRGYYLLIDDNDVIGYVGGLKNDQPLLPDEMYHDVSLHHDDYHYQTVFSLAVLPQYQRKGYATQLMKEYINIISKEDISGIVLTCKDHLVEFYRSFGYEDQGICDSNHGGGSWHLMYLTIKKD